MVYTANAPANPNKLKNYGVCQSTHTKLDLIRTLVKRAVVTLYMVKSYKRGNMSDSRFPLFIPPISGVFGQKTEKIR